jgi:hypothetical protein
MRFQNHAEVKIMRFQNHAEVKTCVSKITQNAFPKSREVNITKQQNHATRQHHVSHFQDEPSFMSACEKLFERVSSGQLL